MNKEVDFHDCIIIGGVVHVLTDEIRRCDGVVISNVCTLCSLRGVCSNEYSDALCDILEAADNEYFTQAASVVHYYRDGSWRIEDDETRDANLNDL